MPNSIKYIVACGCVAAISLASAACSPRRIPPMTVTDMMEDRVVLDGVLLKCNRDPAKARNDTDCQNARIAVERLASKQVDPAVEAKHQEEFERSREQLRLIEDKKRAEEAAKKPKVDVYNMPVVPVESKPSIDPQSPKDPQSVKDPQAAIVGQTKP